jgi:hypothetical protein
MFATNVFNYWNNNLSKWRKKVVREDIISNAGNQLYRRMVTQPTGKRSKSLLDKMEILLHAQIKQQRENKRKVSQRWICLTAQKIQRELDKQNSTRLSNTFKASRGWFHRFLKRWHIKFRKRKSGKKRSTDENMEAILKWYAYYREEVLPKRVGEDLAQFSDKYGRYPPHLRYNVDQVPLPFIVSQDSTYTLGDDMDIQVSGHGKGDPRKRQFTMHIVMNAGVGFLRDGYIELICRGKIMDGTRFSLAERSQWHPDVKMYFQKNAWMDRNVMAHSAERFNDHIKTRWGPEAKALLTCDNLDAHVFSGTKEIFGKEGRVFLFCFPPQVTEAIQPIDAGYGRSIRCAIGRLLDNWLMESDNMEKWETGMTAGERRVLISHFVAAANTEVLKMDESRVSCFERCGVLLTLDGSDDELIRPQGCTQLPVKIPTTVDLTGENFNEPEEILQPEIWDFGITEEDSEIHEGLPVDEAEEGELAVHAEGDSDESLPTLPAVADEESEPEEEEKEDDGPAVAVPDPEENALIGAHSRSGRRVAPKKRFPCEGFY